MASIATLASFLGTIQKFLGVAAKDGLPDEFYQKVIDDPTFRAKFITWAQGCLNPHPFWEYVSDRTIRVNINAVPKLPFEGA